MGRLTMGFRDYNREGSNVSVRLDGQDTTEAGLLAFLAAGNALITAINDVSLGLHTRTVRVWDEENLAAPTAAAASTDAQRERKWAVKYYDATTFKVSQFEIPAADLSLLQENSDYMDLSAGAGLALKTAIEDNVVSMDGNEIIVYEVQHVGRNT